MKRVYPKVLDKIHFYEYVGKERGENRARKKKTAVKRDNPFVGASPSEPLLLRGEALQQSGKKKTLPQPPGRGKLPRRHGVTTGGACRGQLKSGQEH